MLKLLGLQYIQPSDFMKQKLVESSVLLYFSTLTYNEDWQIKLLNDKQFIQLMLALPESERLWNTIFNIAQHPDGKTLLPKDTIAKASKSTYVKCPSICALLCSEDDLKEFKLSANWIETTRTLLNSVLATGKGMSGRFNFFLLDLLLPIANLSVVDTHKELLGKEVVPQLMQVLVGKLPDAAFLKRYLPRGRQEASRALWNFAYLESNRKLISHDNGIEKLNAALTTIDDPIVQKNISGILRMFTAPPESMKETGNNGTQKGHVMISYNWGNQPIVKKLAKSLKERGYIVWLDIERMEGSTLEAMASAVEHAEVVLICMSQKYQDSPNCRLEGEYCVNRKVKFVPLMMQQGYRPDGWLGITLGAKLYYDFTNEDNWDSKIADLTKAIGERGKGGGELSSSVSDPEVQNKKSIIDWTDEDVHDWMTANHIKHHRELFKKHKLGGRSLQEFKRLHTFQQSNFIFQVCEKLGITEVGEVFLVSAAIHNLVI